jgi:hypothetical protein
MSNSRRDFMKTSAGVGAVLALASQTESATPLPPTEIRTLFFDLSHEQHEGHNYYLMLGKQRYPLSPLGGRPPVHSRAYRHNRFAQMLPNGALTHMVENIPISNLQVQLTYIIKDPDPSTGTWQMSGMLLVLPGNAVSYAYQQAIKHLSPGSPLKLSAKRRKYGLPAASSLQDLLDEQDVLDTTEFASTLVNLHPELICADPPTAAHIQTNHIKHLGAINDLSGVLQGAGPAAPAQSPELDDSNWGTLVPYTDTDGVTPLKNKYNGLILYDTQWNPKLQDPWVGNAMRPAIQSVKDDTSLGADVTSRSAGPNNGDLLGTIWHRNDGVAAINQPAGAISDPSNVNYTLSNITPYLSGYSVSSVASQSGGSEQITLTFKNWYVRWLGLYIQFLDANGQVVPKSKLPGISNQSQFDTDSDALYLGSLSPEFTILGIPTSEAQTVASFTFPTNVASSARILGSGLGYGSHTFPDTETLGVAMTSIFNLSLPALLLAIGLGVSIDVFYKQVLIPNLNLVITEFVLAEEGGTSSQFLKTFWHAIVTRTIAGLGPFLESMYAFIGEEEAEESILDAIPLVGAILQAIGAVAVIAQMAETSIEVGLSPWTYQYDLVGTYDLSVPISPDSTDPNGFPVSAANYKVTAVFDNGTPVVQTLTMQGDRKAIQRVVFSQVPLGGNVTVNVGFYAEDGTQVGHGSSFGANVPSSLLGIEITQVPLPIGPGVTYQHKQKTALDGQGNHFWDCTTNAPAPPANPSVCASAPGDLCSLRNITYNSGTGDIGYAWQSFDSAGCTSGAAQLDQIANIPGVNGSNNNAQSGYATIPCGLISAARLVYDPLGRPNSNYYVDTTAGTNILRQIQLNPPSISDPRSKQAWGKFNLIPDDVLLHPSGKIVTISAVTSRMESLKIPASVMSDAEAGINALANLHGGQGTRPGLFNAPTVATITAEGVILIVEAGNNRIHAVDATGNPVKFFSKQPEPYFLNFSVTGGPGTQYLDIAVEFSGFIYILSYNGSVYRLDIYRPDQSTTDPITKTMGFNAAKVTVDYWRTVYSLNYEVLMIKDSLPNSGVTEPSISQWIPTTPPPCEGVSVRPNPTSARAYQRGSVSKRLLRRRFWQYQ